jgi:hypothetical protein
MKHFPILLGAAALLLAATAQAQPATPIPQFVKQADGQYAFYVDG